MGNNKLMLTKTRSALKSSISQILVEWGVAMDRSGAKLSYEASPHLHYSRHRTIAPIESSKPTFNTDVRIAYTASIEGGVELDKNVIVGSFSTLRANASPIRIGEGTIIGDNVTMHTLDLHKEVPGSIDIGSNVYIGDKATLKCCIIDDGAYIGEGSFIGEGAIIQRDAVVLPGTTVQPGAILVSGKVWGGNPCREITEASEKYTSRVKERIDSTRSYIDSIENNILYLQIARPQQQEQTEQSKESDTLEKQPNK